jgi:hypothetical protein
MSRYCPDRTSPFKNGTKPEASGSGQSKPAGKPKPRVRATATEEVVDDRDPEETEEDPPAYSAEGVEATIRALTTEERNKLYEQIAEEQGF